MQSSLDIDINGLSDSDDSGSLSGTAGNGFMKSPNLFLRWSDFGCDSDLFEKNNSRKSGITTENQKSEGVKNDSNKELEFIYW